ncbi:hypothetical protein A3J15_00570 [Candidatus Roizmanbacteria bacterium RIFCSPLOWO2_02_FULL_38_10]|uniref:Peptidase M3A/M3B catalytic domain-containing protein n=1 Tax=Candidatus Roizmanbacteria bacterium RIFCSPLOWO2_02_FULL_38_10 TaxID=1802074 RepID=A0A1F7JKD5_9BACT|nr:MAG: hypothetical protein A3J15_00570 [Candidatus Roizmanbacteria bacterium RIFCSPLOWO2_02_FULL_38_10]
MTTTLDFRQVNPALREKYDLAGLIHRWSPLSDLFTGRDVTPGTLLATGLCNADLARAYEDTLRAAAAVDVSEWVVTPADTVFSYFGRLATLGEADQLRDPVIGRPSIGFNAVIGIGSLLHFLRSNLKQSPFDRQDHRRGQISHFLLQDPTSVLEAMDMWFGPGSVGLLSEDERAATLEAITGCLSVEARKQYLAWWHEAGGDTRRFRSFWWKHYVSGMRRVEREVRALSPSQGVRRGVDAYEELFDRLQIGHGVLEILAWAERMYEQLTITANQLAKSAGYQNWQQMWTTAPTPWTSPEALLAEYRVTTERVIATLMEGGFIPPAPEDFAYSIELTPPEDRAAIPIAALHFPPFEAEGVRSALFVVTPPGDDMQLWRQHFYAMATTAAHEIVGHAWGGGLAPHRVPVEAILSHLTALPVMEGVAFTMELALMTSPGFEPTKYQMLAVLQGRLWRAARVIAEIKYHCGDELLPQIVDEYRERSQISPEMAQRDMRRAAQSIFEFMAYYLGASGIQNAGRHFEGGWKQALARIQNETAGMIPPHVYLQALGLLDDPRQFDWLCDEDIAVQVCRELFPPDSTS